MERPWPFPDGGGGGGQISWYVLHCQVFIRVAFPVGRKSVGIRMFDGGNGNHGGHEWYSVTAPLRGWLRVGLWVQPGQQESVALDRPRL